MDHRKKLALAITQQIGQTCCLTQPTSNVIARLAHTHVSAIGTPLANPVQSLEACAAIIITVPSLTTMATYAIGDVQGCHDALQRLVQHIRFDPTIDRLWFVGDLVNRGPDSLGVLRYIRSLGSSAQVVLGNHDIFLLAVSEEVVAPRPKDTIGDILKADDRLDLINWLRHQPLHYREGPFFMIHAGLLPQWTTEEAARLAGEVETALRGDGFRSFLRSLFHEPVITWNPSLTGASRLGTIARVLTRLRTCTPAGDMSSFSGLPEDAPPGYQPWFSIAGRKSATMTLVTGHWAALGLRIEPNLLAIDSGCVWGRQLTAVRLEDRQVFQVSCAAYQ